MNSDNFKSTVDFFNSIPNIRKSIDSPNVKISYYFDRNDSSEKELAVVCWADENPYHYSNSLCWYVGKHQDWTSINKKEAWELLPEEYKKYFIYHLEMFI